jgi:hypothetical protein
VTPAQTLSTAELVDVLVWCEEVELVASLLSAAQTQPAMPFVPLARGQRLPSPVTSDLGPLATGGWGPAQDAVLVWHSSCRCWEEKEPFADRGGGG